MTPETPLLEGRNLSKIFPIEGGVFRKQVGSVRALDDVSFQVRTGEVLALVGGSGCGKSTLAKVIVGLLAQDSGTLLWEGKSLSELNQRERAQKIQMIFQDPYASLNPKLSIGTQLQEVLRVVTPADRKPGSIRMVDPGVRRDDDAVALLESVGLGKDALTHYPFQFSGGQRQRIAIARALATQPKLLIADEPLSALDVTTQAQILELLRTLQKTLGLTVLFITHDLAVSDAFADRILVLKDGRVVEEGPVRQVLASPQNDYTKALVQAVPRISW